MRTTYVLREILRRGWGKGGHMPKPPTVIKGKKRKGNSRLRSAYLRRHHGLFALGKMVGVLDMNRKQLGQKSKMESSS